MWVDALRSWWDFFVFSWYFSPFDLSLSRKDPLQVLRFFNFSSSSNPAVILGCFKNGNTRDWNYAFWSFIASNSYSNSVMRENRCLSSLSLLPFALFFTQKTSHARCPLVFCRHLSRWICACPRRLHKLLRSEIWPASNNVGSLYPHYSTCPLHYSRNPPKLLSGPHITPDRGWPSSLSLLLYRPNGRTFNFRRIHFAKLNNYGFIALVSFVLCGSKTIVLYVSGVFISHDVVLIVWI